MFSLNYKVFFYKDFSSFFKFKNRRDKHKFNVFVFQFIRLDQSKLVSSSVYSVFINFTDNSDIFSPMQNEMI